MLRRKFSPVIVISRNEVTRNLPLRAGSGRNPCSERIEESQIPRSAKAQLSCVGMTAEGEISSPFVTEGHVYFILDWSL
jgi:hypothetical protein